LVTETTGAVVTTDDSAETTIGPEPAEEITPASDEAIMLAPTADASDDVAVEAGVVEAGAVVVLVVVVLLLVADPGAGQVRLYKGVVLSVEPTIPKLGLGVTGAASWSVYQ